MAQPLGVRLGAEALGTFLFFFLGFSGVAILVDIGADAITPLGVAAGFGFGLSLAITAFGHLSGGHFNPAVTAALVVAGRFRSREVIPYWVAQLVGGFGAVLVMAIVYSGEVMDALHTQPGSGVDDWAALVLEIVATALFVMVILTVATDERAAWNGVMAPFLIGLFVFTAAVTVGPAADDRGAERADEVGHREGEEGEHQRGEAGDLGEEQLADDDREARVDDDVEPLEGVADRGRDDGLARLRDGLG